MGQDDAGGAEAGQQAEPDRVGAPHRQRGQQGHPDAEARAGLLGDPAGEHGGPQRPDHGRRGRRGAGDEGGGAEGADAAVDGNHQEDRHDVGGPGRHRDAQAAAGQLGRLGPGDVRGERVERAGHHRVGEPGGAHRGHGGAAGLQDVAGQQGVVHAVPPGWLGEPAEQEPAEAGGQHGRDAQADQVEHGRARPHRGCRRDRRRVGTALPGAGEPGAGEPERHPCGQDDPGGQDELGHQHRDRAVRQPEPGQPAHRDGGQPEGESRCRSPGGPAVATRGEGEREEPARHGRQGDGCQHGQHASPLRG